MPHRKTFLDRLEPAILDRLRPHLAVVDLPQGEVLAKPTSALKRSTFHILASSLAWSNCSVAALSRPV